jgi:ABC-type sugar transport system ATPase subunit
VAQAIAPELDLDVPVMFLPPAERQFVRLLRAIADKGRLLILDEPTAALPAEDAERFYDVLRRTRERGTAIILVSHRLDEIADFCGSAVVLRDGRIVARFGEGEVKPDSMIAAMGGSVGERSTKATDMNAPKVIELDGVAAGDLTRPAVLDVHAGEVMALYGLAGSGRSSLLNAIWGAIPWTGVMRLEGKAYAPRSPREAIARGVSCVPADRHRSGLFLDQDLVFNKTLPLLAGYRRMKGVPVPDRAAEREEFRVAAERVSLSYREPGQLARTLSGGNQQKLIFSRWANRHSKVMLLDEPTEGVDVMAKAAIKDIIRAIAGDGNAVLVSTSDRDEALELGDRIAVFRNGGIVKVFSRAEASAEALSAAAQSREAA